jgi:hypothetical protein
MFTLFTQLSNRTSLASDQKALARTRPPLPVIGFITQVWLCDLCMTKAFIQATCKIGHRSFTRTRWFTESQPKGFTPWKLREPCGTQTLGSCQQAWQFELIWINHLRVPHLFGNSMWVCLNGRTPQFIRHRRKVHLQTSLCTSLTQNIKNHPPNPWLSIVVQSFSFSLKSKSKGCGSKLKTWGTEGPQIYVYFWY